MAFWGNGKMLVSLPAPLLDVTEYNVSCFEFAGLRSNRVTNPPAASTHATEPAPVLVNELPDVSSTMAVSNQ
jgi:hypothetical protein